MPRLVAGIFAALVLLTLGGLLFMRTQTWKRIQLRRASILAATNRVDAMIRLLRRNRDRRSVLDPLTNALIYYFIRAGRLDDAEDIVAEAIQKGDSSGTALGQLGLIASGRGRMDEAEHFYRKALEKDSSLIRSLGVNLAGLLIEKRQGLDEAERLLEQALEMREGASKSGVHVNIALLGLAKGEFRDALVHAMTGYELMPAGESTRGPRAQALALAARASGLLGEREEAVELSRKALDLLEGLQGFDKLRTEVDEMAAEYGKPAPSPGRAPRGRLNP